jgi:L-fuconolactonase
MKTKRLEGRSESIIEPGLPIIDCHVHLFDLPNNKYMLDDYLDDVRAGHNIVGSIYCETQSFARKDGPEWMRPLGEVEFANGVAAMSASGTYGLCRVNAGIIGHANMTFGSHISELLDRCLSVAPERYRGVRHVTLDYPDERPFKFIMTHRPPSGILETSGFPLALAELGKRGLIFDAAVYNPSIPRLASYADEFPNLIIVLNHIGMPVGVDMVQDEKKEMIKRWTDDLKAIAKRPNVFCKISGLGMPIFGFEFETRDDTVGSIELASTWKPYVEKVIDAFGVERCMLASNFPPDGRSSGYVPLWNAYKLIFQSYSPSEKAAIFGGNAKRVYRLNILDL